MEPHKTHDAACEAVDSATAGSPLSPGVSASVSGEFEAVDSAAAGTPLSPGVSASVSGEFEAVDSAAAGTPLSPGVSASVSGEFEAVDSAAAGTPLSPGVSASVSGEFEAVDSAAAGTPLSPGVSASVSEEFEAVDSAAAGTPLSPGVSASVSGEFKAVDSAAAGTPLSPGVSANVSGECKTVITTNPEEITRLDFYHALVSAARSYYNKGRPRDLNIEERLTMLKKIFGNRLKLEESYSHRVRIVTAVNNFIIRTEKMYAGCKRHYKLFVQKHKNWLEKPFLDDLPAITENCSEITSIPTSTSHSKPSTRQQADKRKCLRPLLNKEPPKKAKKLNSKTVIADSVEAGSSHSAPSTQALENVISVWIPTPKKINEIKSEVDVPSIRPYSPEEALSLKIDVKLSISAYQIIREYAPPLWPPYDQVRMAKKLCHPAGDLQVSDDCLEASIPLFNLLEHTFQRIVQTADGAINQFCHENRLSQLHSVFEGSWGFDSTSHQCRQRRHRSEINKSNILATTFVPLQISSGNHGIWLNPRPQSYRYCRPIRLQYRKETLKRILNEKSYVEKEIDRLVPLKAITSQGIELTASVSLTLCLVDEKVVNTLTGTNSQSKCSICRMTRRDFNNLDLDYSKLADPDALRHGIIPVHAWVRVLEFLLDLGYKKDPAGSEQTSGKSVDVEARKKHVQEEITSVLQLYVDEVKSDGALTNNWYTARTALSDKYRHKFADILGIEHWLVDGLHFILIAITSGLPIDADKFGDVCRDLAHRYVSQYAWHPMTVTIHKILVHGKDIINSTKLGMLSQQSAQPRNRFWRSGCDRNHKTITSQSQHITDLFYRALESSDPVITDMGRSRIGKYQKLNIPDEMKSILLPIRNRNNINLDCGDDVHVSYEECDDDDDDDDDDVLNGFCLDREDLG